VTICGIMQHIEQAGVHSGDSACSIPTQTIDADALAVIRDWTPKIARALKVVGDGEGEERRGRGARGPRGPAPPPPPPPPPPAPGQKPI